jgi:hypothetical protein
MSHFEDVTIQDLMRQAIESAKDDEASVECYYRNVQDYDEQIGPVIRCTVAELPQRTFNDGFGGVEGEAIIAFSSKYVYVKGVYDGSEWIQAIPRHPDSINPEELPQVGGG